MELDFKLKTTLEYTIKVFNDGLLNIRYYEFKRGFVDLTVRVDDNNFDKNKRFTTLTGLVKYANMQNKKNKKNKKRIKDGKNCIR